MPERPNVLLIAIDDLRPELGCYDRPSMHTPYLDRFAASAVQFDRAYCQVPVCGASRASLFTGTRPGPNRFTNHYTWAQEDAPESLCLHEHLRNAGYYTVSRGKVFHQLKDQLQGWSEPPTQPKHSFLNYQDPENVRFRDEGPGKPRGPAWEALEALDGQYADHKLTDGAIGDLGRLKARDEPFMLAVGYTRPHLPFVAPKKYWDLYDDDEIELPPNFQKPTDVPSQAVHESGELCSNYTGVPDEGPIDPQTARNLIHGYRAAVSFLDAQIGRLVDGLNDQGLDENTVVVFCVDHGWNLGEHGLWCKHCLYETSLQVPLLIRAPGFEGARAAGLVENMDIYPTLCEVLALAEPDHLQGQSLLPQMHDPTGPGKLATFSRFLGGESVRTDQFRYSEWRSDGQVVGRTLFDHHADPSEDVNLADRPEYAQTVAELASLLPSP